MRTIRLATPADLQMLMGMYAHSRGIMRSHGNTVQWVGYPTEADVLEDIRRGVCHLVADEGCFALVPGDEPTYATIERGRWIEPHRPYATLHRLACAPHGRGIAAEAFAYAAARYDYLRADTHPTNLIMRRLLEGFGFVECGTVWMSDGTPRLAYEWWRFDEVEPSLREYIEGEVLPRYDAFDAAHRRPHARRVMARAMAMAKPYADPALARMAHAAAAMHDLGLTFGREEHHLHSGRIIRGCEALRQWFSPDEVEQMACAAEDHRASASKPPRSLLGCIVAEADRDIEPYTILRRTAEFSRSHFPHFTAEQHLARCLAHLHEKYSAEGYIRLWLEPSPNAEPLAELRALIADEAACAALLSELITPSQPSQS